MYKYKRNGFTLVELMAVIIIISLIALLTFPNIINQIKKTKKSNNKMIEDVIIEQAKKYVSDNEDELTDDEYCLPISTLIDNDYIKEDIVNINDIKDNKVVHITLDNNNSYEVLDKNKCFLSAVKYLLKKTNPITITNYIDGDIHEMYTFEHEATEQTPALTDYRYIGSDPNNYVEFNNEVWRIIGVFDADNGTGKYEKRIKIVRDKSIGNIQWNSTNENEWLNSTIQKYLNETYLLDDIAGKMIENNMYYLGGKSSYSNGEIFYKSERGIDVYVGRSINWLGKIALIYPSDYIFTYANGVDDICYNTPSSCKSDSGAEPKNGWLYFSENNQWTVMPGTTQNAVLRVRSPGNISSDSQYSANRSYSIKPVMYLKSYIKITSGDGTESNPYKLSM